MKGGNGTSTPVAPKGWSPGLKPATLRWNLKLMVGRRWFPFWNGIFLGASARVTLSVAAQKWWICGSMFVILSVGSKIFFVTKLPTANNAFLSSLGSFFYTKSKSLGNLQWQKPRTLRQILFELGRMINKHPQILNLEMLRLHLYISFVCAFWWLDRPWGKNCFYVLKMPGEMTKH